MPLVSAIITTHNRPQLLECAIKSVLQQTFHNLECIVVDDASSDSTESIYKDDSRIIYVRIPSEESRGGNHARNVGVQHAKGEYVAFLDDDDIWLPQKIEKQLNLFQQNSKSVVFCGRIFKKISSGKCEYQQLIPPEKFSGNISRLILCTYVTSTSCLMIPKSLFAQVGLFDENLIFWQEYELTIRLAQIAPFYFVPEPLVECLDESGNSQRISNKFINWKKNISYIRTKHAILYNGLSFKENWIYHATLSKDAFRRSLRSGIKKNVFFYGVLRLLLEFIPSRILHLF